MNSYETGVAPVEMARDNAEYQELRDAAKLLQVCLLIKPDGPHTYWYGICMSVLLDTTHALASGMLNHVDDQHMRQKLHISFPQHACSLFIIMYPSGGCAAVASLACHMMSLVPAAAYLR